MVEILRRELFSMIFMRKIILKAVRFTSIQLQKIYQVYFRLPFNLNIENFLGGGQMKLLYEHDIIKQNNSSARCLKCLKLSFLSLTPNCKTTICIYRRHIYMANSRLTSLTQLMIRHVVQEQAIKLMANGSLYRCCKRLFFRIIKTEF